MTLRAKRHNSCLLRERRGPPCFLRVKNPYFLPFRTPPAKNCAYCRARPEDDDGEQLDERTRKALRLLMSEIRK
jgi:hypothetical protein